jgi:hypothetical protein
MGIYSNGSIFGISIYTLNEDDYNINKLFEEKYDEIMSHEQIREAYLFYKELNDKNNLLFNVFTECTSTLDIEKHNFMKWHRISLNQFLENFDIE